MPGKSDKQERRLTMRSTMTFAGPQTTAKSLEGHAWKLLFCDGPAKAG
jgi:hypothetical protein